MEWFTQVVVFGLAALALFVCSMLCTALKRHTAGFAFGVLELAAAAVSGRAWAAALLGSGKSDFFLLGIFTYPGIALVFWSMFMVGALCIVWSVVEQKHQSGAPAVES
ncbi:MAG: hypothetical protein K2K53_13175 [Oscillospiraceae bacterium]|nr:hypothetical protein [Oscillospiraceae bacterium]